MDWLSNLLRLTQPVGDGAEVKLTITSGKIQGVLNVPV